MAHMTVQELNSLNVGDIVRVRTREDMLAEHGVGENGNPDVRLSMTDEMVNYCGKDVIVRAVYQQDVEPYIRIIQDDDDDEWDWNWSEEMLEPLYCDEPVDDLDEEQIQKDYMQMFFEGDT